MGTLQLTIALPLLAASASAQSLNLRYTPWAPLPAPTYGAATGQAGAWNAIKTPTGEPETILTSLVGLDGGAVAAYASMTGCDASGCSWTGYGTDVQGFFAGFVNSDCFADPSHTVLVDLQEGDYVLTAYGTPCGSEPNKKVTVKVTDQSFEATATLFGEYQGSFDSMQLGTFAFHLPDDVNVSLRALGYACMSSVQLNKIEPPASYCTSKVNSQGCAAKIAAIGNTASLGNASPFHLVATDVVNDVPGLLFYGFAQDIKPFMGGLHCVKPPTPRTWGQFSGGNGVPCAGTFDLDFNAWLSTQPQPKVYAGMRLYAQYWYRDVADPFGAATSDAVGFHVVP